MNAPHFGLILSVPVLLILFGYSYTKRFTSLSHVVLGFAIGLAPLGAWLAIRGEFDWLPMLLSAAVMFWIGGFDIIYSCQDIEFDRSSHLFSRIASVHQNTHQILELRIGRFRSRL